MRRYLVCRRVDWSGVRKLMRTQSKDVKGREAGRENGAPGMNVESLSWAAVKSTGFMIRSCEWDRPKVRVNA